MKEKENTMSTRTLAYATSSSTELAIDDSLAEGATIDGNIDEKLIAVAEDSAEATQSTAFDLRKVEYASMDDTLIFGPVETDGKVESDETAMLSGFEAERDTPPADSTLAAKTPEDEPDTIIFTGVQSSGQTSATALFTPDLDPSDAGGLGAAIATLSLIELFVHKVDHILETAHEFASLAKSIVGLFDTPENNVPKWVAEHTQMLEDIKNDLTAMKLAIDEILEGIEGLSDQIDTNLINSVMIDAMNLMKLLQEDQVLSAEQLYDITVDAEDLMNSLTINISSVLEDAPYEMITGQIVPTIMVATSAYIAAMSYASDEGLGSLAVQGNIGQAQSLLADIFSSDGPLSEALVGPLSGFSYDGGPTGGVNYSKASGFEYETFSIYGEDANQGAGGGDILRFLTIETITGPSGAKVHTVTADHTYDVGEAAIVDFGEIYYAEGSINGISANGIDLGQIDAILAGLTVDLVVPFDPNDENQLIEASQGPASMRHEANLELRSMELLNFGGDTVEAFRWELPNTAGLNESDAGGAGNDHIIGTNGVGDIAFDAPDLIKGGGGNDILEGLGDNDALFGESGDDDLYGGDGGDKLFGGAGSDELFGGNDHDVLQGQDGRDTLEGGDGHDALYQGDRDDGVDMANPDAYSPNDADGGRLNGDVGNDLLVGDNGDDEIFGGHGHDTILAYGDDDDIEGGLGNDHVYAGAGNDTINGGGGDDSLVGGDGNDEIDGGSGNDTILGGAGDDDISGGYGVDTVVFSGSFNGPLNTGKVENYLLPGADIETDYSIEQAENGDWIVTDLRENGNDGVDIIRAPSSTMQNDGAGVEFLRFDNDVIVALTPDVLGPDYAVDTGAPKGDQIFDDLLTDFSDDPNDVGVWSTIDLGQDTEVFALLIG